MSKIIFYISHLHDKNIGTKVTIFPRNFSFFESIWIFFSFVLQWIPPLKWFLYLLVPLKLFKYTKAHTQNSNQPGSIPGNYPPVGSELLWVLCVRLAIDTINMNYDRSKISLQIINVNILVPNEHPLSFYVSLFILKQVHAIHILFKRITFTKYKVIGNTLLSFTQICLKFLFSFLILTKKHNLHHNIFKSTFFLCFFFTIPSYMYL